MTKKFICQASLAGLTLLILAIAVVAAVAQSIDPPTAVIKPASQLRVPPPQVRTRAQMEAAALEAAGPPPPAQVKKFLPTRGAAAYKALKAESARTSALQAPLAPGIESAAPLAPTALTNPINFEGVDSVTAGNWRPPDTHGAAGLNHFVEITNAHVDIYEKAAPNNRVNGNGVSLNSFFGYTKPDWPNAQNMFDPRVIYDPVFNRWIMSAVAFAESATVQYFFFAVSQTADPLGSFYIYRVNVSDGNGTGLPNDVEWDFPQLGLDHQAVIFTANFFHGDTFIDARMFTVAKSLLYSGPGQTLTPHLFTGLRGTLAPPIVLDVNPNTYLVAADAPDNKVWIYTLTNSAADPPTLSAPATIPVTAFTFPANAPQPGTTALLDTSDARFVNAGTQIGNSLFQVHSIASGGFARCRFYEFDTVTRTVIQSGDFRRSSTSYDFNVSIAANRRKDVFVTWTATDTDPTNSANAEVRFSGRLRSDPLGVIPGPGSLLSGSATFYSPAGDPKRWGDYSAVSLDPADPTGATAWIVNEKILTNNSWGSQIGRIGLPFNSSLPAVYLPLLLD